MKHRLIKSRPIYIEMLFVFAIVAAATALFVVASELAHLLPIGAVNVDYGELGRNVVGIVGPAALLGAQFGVAALLAWRGYIETDMALATAFQFTVTLVFSAVIRIVFAGEISNTPMRYFATAKLLIFYTIMTFTVVMPTLRVNSAA